MKLPISGVFCLWYHGYFLVMKSPKNSHKENPFLSLCFNILIPVLVLRNGDKWLGKFLLYINSGNSDFQKSYLINTPPIVFIIALTFPITYFIYDLFKRKNINFISIIGFINILLTGGIGIFGAKLGLSKNWFILKEGLLPFIIGLCLLIISKYRQNVLMKILLNDALFHNDKIQASIKEDEQNEFENMVKKAGYYLIAGLFISCIIQFILASIIVVSNPGEPSFNKQVSTMTWISYIAVLLPTMFILGKGYWDLTSGIERLTGLKKEEFLKS